MESWQLSRAKNLDFTLIKVLRHTSVQIQFSSVAQSCPTLWDPMDCSMPGVVHHQLPELAQTHVHWVSEASNHLILCHPLLLLPSIFPRIRVFSNESVLHIRWPNYRSLAFLKSEHFGALIQSLSHIQLSVTPRTAACQIPLSSAISQSLLQFMSIELVMLSI